MKKLFLKSLIAMIAFSILGCNSEAKFQSKKKGQSMALLNVDFNTLNNCISEQLHKHFKQIEMKKISDKKIEYNLFQNTRIYVSERDEKVQGMANSIAVSSYPKTLAGGHQLKINRTLSYCYDKLADKASGHF